MSNRNISTQCDLARDLATDASMAPQAPVPQADTKAGHPKRVKRGVAMSGVTVSKSEISAVGSGDHGILLRGYSLLELASKCEFEEVAHLLIYDKLPNTEELKEYKSRLQKLRIIPQEVKEVLEKLPSTSHPMDVLRTGVSVLGCLEPEEESPSVQQARSCADRILASIPGILLYWHHFVANGNRIATESAEDTIAGHFLALLHQSPPSAEHVRAMHVSLILYSEHGLAASTFCSKVAAGTQTDLFSCACAGIAALKGQKHGGANEAAMKTILEFKSPDEAEEEMKARIARKQIVIGFGHPVYFSGDPRNETIKQVSKSLCAAAEKQHIFDISERIETTMARQKSIFANLDWYSASVYWVMGIPIDFFTTVFVLSRFTGWTAHILEQRYKDCRIIRPLGQYIGVNARAVTAIEERE